jgi:hypothetical protein
MNGGVDVTIVCEIPHIDTAQIRTDVLPTQYRVNQTSNPPPPAHNCHAPFTHLFILFTQSFTFLCYSIAIKQKRSHSNEQAQES